MTTVEIRNAAKAFGATSVFEGLDIHVAHGEFVALLGPSGCGKSTLLRCVAGLEDLTSGDVRFGGRSVIDVPPARRGAAMVFQTYALYPHKTVRENMGFALRVAGAPAPEIEARVDEAAAMLDIAALLDQRPRQLSGGQRQRVAIGRAIVRRPDVFLFDEPLSNLDAALRAHMRLELSRLHRRLEATMIYVTHDQVEAMTMADRIVVLEGGRVRQIGAPQEVFDAPADTFVARFIGSPAMNLLPMEAVDTPANRERLAKRYDASALRKARTLGIRPEDATLGCGGADADGRWVELPVAVDLIESLGRQRLLYSRSATEGGPAVDVTILAHGGEPHEGSVARFPVSLLHLFDECGARIAPRSP